MKTVSVTRKPLYQTTAKTAVRFGSGGLNIDASRIGSGADIPSIHTVRRSDYPQSYDRVDGAGWGRSRGGLAGDEVHWEPNGGRWPTNVILQHTPECRQVGSTTVTRNLVVPRKVQENDWDGGGPWKSSGMNVGKVDEQVPVWDCPPRCPVAALDADSGLRRSAGLYPSDSEGTGVGTTYMTATRPQGQLYNDSGGASRYFKQVQGEMAQIPQDLIDYLSNMIGTPELPGIYWDPSEEGFDDMLNGLDDDSI